MGFTTRHAGCIHVFGIRYEQNKRRRCRLLLQCLKTHINEAMIEFGIMYNDDAPKHDIGKTVIRNAWRRAKRPITLVLFPRGAHSYRYCLVVPEVS